MAGVLLFDGYRFSQWLRGPAPAIDAVMGRIVQDPRHERMVMLLDSEASAAPLLRQWTSGYCEPHALDDFEGPRGLRGNAALLRFRRVVGSAEVWPAIA